MAEASHTRQTIKRSWDRLGLVLAFLLVVIGVNRCADTVPAPDSYWEEGQ